MDKLDRFALREAADHSLLTDVARGLPKLLGALWVVLGARSLPSGWKAKAIARLEYMADANERMDPRACYLGQAESVTPMRWS